MKKLSINHKSLIDAAMNHKNKLPKFRSYGISELLKMPTFFDWVECILIPEEKSFQMYLAGADDGVALRFFWNGSYEKMTLSLWGHFVSRGGLIIDIGAHTGAYTLAAYSVDINANILSFEPHFMNFSRLNMNLRGNGFSTSNIHMIGVGEKNEILPFSVFPNINYLTSGGSVGTRENSLVTNIQVVSLDQLLPDKVAADVRLIKIDVEGHEGACLRGMVNLIERYRPVIFFECIANESGSTVSSILKNFDYNFYMIDDENGDVTQVDDIYPQMDLNGNIIRSKLNRIALPNQELLKYLKNVSVN